MDDQEQMEAMLRGARRAGVLADDRPPSAPEPGRPEWYEAAVASVAAPGGSPHGRRLHFAIAAFATAALVAAAFVVVSWPLGADIGPLSAAGAPARSLPAVSVLPPDGTALLFAGERAPSDFEIGYRFEAVADHEGSRLEGAVGRAGRLRLGLDRRAAAWVSRVGSDGVLLSALLAQSDRATRTQSAHAKLTSLGPEIVRRFHLGRWLYLASRDAAAGVVLPDESEARVAAIAHELNIPSLDGLDVRAAVAKVRSAVLRAP